MISLTVAMPALNEEKNIVAAVTDTLNAFKAFGIKAEVLVVNDGSTDATGSLVRELMRDFPGQVDIIEHVTPCGIGASFWDAVDKARHEVVCMLPGDNENKPEEIIRYLWLMSDVDMVIPFVFNRNARSAFRNLVSSAYVSIINYTFKIGLTYTNGTVLYRTSVLKSLSCRNKGFFFQTDILVRLLKRGYLYAQVPYRLRTRLAGNPKAISWRSFRAVVKGYIKLFLEVYLLRKEKPLNLIKDSISYQRYNKD
ncbi:MAG: glycosyltransferase family 2 protein [Candidatus Omnitrophica bacterium]|jgi:glycosyltransferase involved in cell wall biosynthesis|nr:glycosyltransferase family 2 protein [Candidatus Omnitrophota bacterium]